MPITPISSVTNQITQRKIRGITPNTSDTLLYAPTLVVRVGLTADTNSYTQGIDYTITSNTISWALLGAEPTGNQAYYITYKYHPTQFLKDFDTVTTELTTDFNTLLPNMDVTKSSSKDLYVNVQGRQFTDEYNAIQHVFLIQALQNVSELTDAELDAIGTNYNMPRLPATKSSGTVRFSLNIAKAYPINISVGTRVGTQPSLTNNQQITFLTTENKTIPSGSLYVDVKIEADNSGATGNVGAVTITIMIDSVGADSVSNGVATTGGQNQEANADYAQRLIDVYKARNIATISGLKGIVLAVPNVIDCYIADVGDSAMTRDGGIGGKVDIYIQSESGFAAQIDNEQYTYASLDYTFLHQPVIAIVEVKVNDVVVLPTTYQRIEDTGTYKKSTRAIDKLHMLSGVVPTDVVKVTYTYNKLFNDIQGVLDSDNYHRAGIDDLVRSAEETFIDVTGAVKIAIGNIFADVQTNIINQISNYIEAKEIGAKIIYGDILNIIHDTPGVEDMTPISKLSRQTENTNSTIQLRGNEYPRAGNIIITQIL